AGGAGDETFSVRAGYGGSASIDAGGGDDTLRGRAAADAFTLTANANEVAYSGVTFSNLENVDGNGGNDTLTAAAGGSLIELISASSAEDNGVLFTALL